MAYQGPRERMSAARVDSGAMEGMGGGRGLTHGGGAPNGNCAFYPQAKALRCNAAKHFWSIGNRGGCMTVCVGATASAYSQTRVSCGFFEGLHPVFFIDLK